MVNGSIPLSAPEHTDDPAGVLSALQAADAYFEGHFLLTSGRHSDGFFLLPRLFQYPQLADPLAVSLARRLYDFGAETVVSPAVGGIILGYEVAKALRVKAMFAEKTGETDRGAGHDRMELRRGFTLTPGEPVVIVEDVVTTGGSIRAAIAAVEEAGGRVVGAGVLIDRSGSAADVGVPMRALMTAGQNDWEPSDCPLCARGVPLEQPKVSPLPAGPR